MYNMRKCAALRFFSHFLLFGRETENKHHCGKYIRRKMQQFTLPLAVFRNIADIAGTEAEAFGSDDGILRGDHGIRHGKQQIADAGTACGAPDAFICVIPLFAICAEHQHHRRTRNERLMVAAVCQCSFQRIVRNIQNCVELLASGARRLHGSRKDCLFHRGRNRFVRIGAHGFARIQTAQNIICITIHIYLLLNELYIRNSPSTFRK